MKMMHFFFMGKTPENIATYYRMNPEQLDVMYIKGAGNLIVLKEKSDTPAYLKEYDKKMNDVTEKLKNSKEREDLYKDRLKSQEERLKKIEHILERNIYDNIAPFEGPRLSKEEDKLEDQLEEQAIQEADEKLKHLIATNPKYKDYEIVYFDQYWDDKTQSFKHGAPFPIKKEKQKIKKDPMTEMNEFIVLNALTNLDEKKL
jgi:hypothetical protein